MLRLMEYMSNGGWQAVLVVGGCGHVLLFALVYLMERFDGES